MVIPFFWLHRPIIRIRITTDSSFSQIPNTTFKNQNFYALSSEYLIFVTPTVMTPVQDAIIFNLDMIAS